MPFVFRPESASTTTTAQPTTSQTTTSQTKDERKEQTATASPAKVVARRRRCAFRLSDISLTIPVLSKQLASTQGGDFSIAGNIAAIESKISKLQSQGNHGEAWKEVHDTPRFVAVKPLIVFWSQQQKLFKLERVRSQEILEATGAAPLTDGAPAQRGAATPRPRGHRDKRDAAEGDGRSSQNANPTPKSKAPPISAAPPASMEVLHCPDHCLPHILAHLCCSSSLYASCHRSSSLWLVLAARL